MTDRNWQSRKVTSFLNGVIRPSGMQLKPRIQADTPPGALMVLFEGADTGMLLANNAELLAALEHVTARMLRMDRGRCEDLCFDAGGFRAEREVRLRCEAAIAINLVESTGQMHAFPPMSCRDRSLLLDYLRECGLRAENVGIGARRHVVLLPRISSPSVRTAAPEPEPRSYQA